MLEVSFEKTMGGFKLQSSFSGNSGVLGILGSSGSGKSMTLKCIAGLVTPDRGMITLNGKRLYHSDEGINVPSRMRNIGYVFQNLALFPHLTVFENIAYGVENLPKEERLVRVTEMIKKVHLSGYEKRYPSQLSGGQQQRAALGRTLVTEPELLLLDEPFSALDSHVKDLLEKELLNIIKTNYHGALLFVTHNVEEAYRLCDRIMILDHGKSVQIGSKEEIILAPVTLSAARITGCRNFFSAEILGEEGACRVIKSGGLLLHTRQKVPEPPRNMMAGIRPQDLRLSSSVKDQTNTYPCEVLEKTDGVFTSTITVSCHGKKLLVELPKNQELLLKADVGQSLLLHFPPEKVFLMKA